MTTTPLDSVNPHVTVPAPTNPTETPCPCGCGLSFVPRDRRQKFLPGHRFAAYRKHVCPECGLTHRVKGQ